ncbi:Hsp70 family protein [Nitrogeniibacter aestuarii]|uniref:Hsp70 family protein n=1 Tax=Nitrogeniibacter aestuarii TaxID=2815343 RepID=UPI001E5338F3|nr:molecular chaperone HscC [Nitrogeniibacter aestuarii]
MMIGIDLGTTNSLVGVFRDGEATLIPNALGHVLTPSAVGIDEQGNMLVGLPARERIATHPDHTAIAFKRWMGTDKTLMLGKKRFRPEELSALVLGALKRDAEAFLGEPVTEAVISVPAYFNEAQRKATKTAAELAGLKVERLLNEPTAAGLAYGLAERQEMSTFLVFDLGGGTFDVSVLEYFEGVVEVRASAGDTRLGGEDFVQVLIRLFLERCKALSAADRERIERDQSLWRIAEQAKRDLGEHEQVVMRLRFGDATHEHTITRADFEAACADLLQRLRHPIERALKDAQLDPGALTEIVLVGGASRMPVVRQMVTRLFGRLPLRHINPDETVARGAAIQAALKARDAALDEVVLTDVMPFSLGIIISQETGGRRIPDRFSPIIERNTPVPVSRVGSYCTVRDQQAAIFLDIRQGESPVGSDNLKLGELEMPVAALPAGEANVDVRFTYDVNGLLDIEVTDTRTGHKVSTVIKQSENVMTEAQIAEALAKLADLKVHPREKQENIYLVNRAKRLYEDNLGEVRQQILDWLSRFEGILESQDERRIRQARTDFAAALDSIDRGFIL